MLKQRDSADNPIPIGAFTTFSKDIFFNENIQPDRHQALADPTPHMITTEELKFILEKKYKATKSRGNSILPPHLLKFMGTAGIGSLANFLNTSAITTAPPQSWRTAKIIPLYKGKGDPAKPENYRSIAITPPLAKVFMATMNHRLTTQANSMNLHAPT
jgi:hypothetical protein